jgi:cholesterol transport system auxiliary component
MQARLIRLPRRTSIAAVSEEHVVRAKNTSLPAIVDAFDEAFGKTLKRIVEWTVIEAATVQTEAAGARSL